LRSTAASHDTIDVLNPSYVPSVHDVASFKDTQRFMCNVFTNFIHTTKGKNCVREASTTLDAQKVYACHLDVYYDHLSIKLNATKICQDLTLMTLDDIWRKSFESFLHFWTDKVQDLEDFEDKLVDDDNKRIWLTNTLSSQPDMDAAIRQAITTELTINGTHGSSTTVTIQWINFYNMALSNAKLMDSTRSKQTGCGQETNQANRNNNNPGSNNRTGNISTSTTSTTPSTFFKWKGPDMVMQKGMHFSPEDLKKCNKAQKDKIYELKKQKNRTPSNNVSFNNTEIQSSPPSTTPNTSPPAPTSILF
jgi:hypothetical protein